MTVPRQRQRRCLGPKDLNTERPTRDLSHCRPGVVPATTPILKPMLPSLPVPHISHARHLSPHLDRDSTTPARSLSTLKMIDTPSSGGTTTRNLRVAFADTPVHLRELEEGWRERRKARLSPRRAVDQLENPSGDEGGGGDTIPLRVRGRRTATVALRGKGSFRGHAMEHKQRGEEQELGHIERRDTRKLTLAPGNTQELLPLPLSSRTSIAKSDKDPSSGLAPRPGLSWRQPRPPALTGEAVREHGASSRPTDQAGGDAALQPPQPILADPLPPTARPVSLGRRILDTIHVRPTPFPLQGKADMYGTRQVACAMVILTASEDIRVSIDGMIVIIVSKEHSEHHLYRIASRTARTGNRTTDQVSKRHKAGRLAAGTMRFPMVLPGQAQTERVISLHEHDQWHQGDRDKWEAIRRLVERYKQTVPYVSLLSHSVCCGAVGPRWRSHRCSQG
jgi:hypothetical protein